MEKLIIALQNMTEMTVVPDKYLEEIRGQLPQNEKECRIYAMLTAATLIVPNVDAVYRYSAVRTMLADAGALERTMHWSINMRCLLLFPSMARILMSSFKGHGERTKRGEMYSLSPGKHRMRLAKLPHTDGDWQMPIACLLGALPLKP